MKKLAIAFAALTTISGVAYSSDFTGFNAQISAGYQNTSSQIDNASQCGTVGKGCYTSKVNNGDVVTRLGLGYTFDLTNQFTLGLEGEYNPLKNSGGDYSVYEQSGVLKPGAGSSFKYKDQYMISLVPGYIIDKNLLAYAKLGYSHVNFYIDGNNAPGTNLDGFNLGLGAKYLITKNIFTFGEFNYISYSNKVDSIGAPDTATWKSSSYDLSVGLGYQF